MLMIFRIIKKYFFDNYYYYGLMARAFESSFLMLAFITWYANIIWNTICVCWAGYHVYDCVLTHGGYFRGLFQNQNMKFKLINSICIDIIVINFIFMLFSTILNICNCTWSYYTLTLIVPLYLFKDNLTGQSIGHAIIGISIVHNDTALRPVRALVRNLFLLIWPIELLLFLFSGRRLGDIVTKTEHVLTERYQRPTNTMLSITLFIIVWGVVIYLFWKFCVNVVAQFIPLTA